MIIAGVLEQLIFLLREKNIEYDLTVLGREKGLREQIIVKFNEFFFFIIKHSHRITYHLAEGDRNKRQVSKTEILKIVKGI
jgi:hypothetical protein